MNKLRHWKYQVMIAAPFVPWLLVNALDMVYETAISVGWDPALAGISAPITVFVASGIFLAGYANIHEQDG